jgi:hypothetical protein
MTRITTALVVTLLVAPQVRATGAKPAADVLFHARFADPAIQVFRMSRRRQEEDQRRI